MLIGSLYFVKNCLNFSRIFRGSPFSRNSVKWPYLRLHTTHTIDIVSILYSTKNKVRGLCVGGDTAILQSSVKIDLTQIFKKQKKNTRFYKKKILQKILKMLQIDKVLD